MSRTIFPLNLTPSTNEETENRKPMYREVKWDFDRNRPVYENGNPVVVEGAGAVLTWAYNALQVERYRFEALSRGYGNEVSSLIGKPYTDALKNAEAVRYVKDCLMVNPYVSGVKNTSVGFDNGTLLISFTLITEYGEVSGLVSV